MVMVAPNLDAPPTHKDLVKKSVPLEVLELTTIEVSKEPIGSVSSNDAPSSPPMKLVDLPGSFFKVEHASATMPDVPSLWHLERCGEYMKNVSFSTPYNLKLLKANLERFIDLDKVMMTRCMTIMRYCKSYMAKRSQWKAKLIEAEKERPKFLAYLYEGKMKQEDIVSEGQCDKDLELGQSSSEEATQLNENIIDLEAKLTAYVVGFEKANKQAIYFNKDVVDNVLVANVEEILKVEVVIEVDEQVDAWAEVEIVDEAFDQDD
ncbi:hypothetical protein V8G54_023298 [Vigna mungo]|uniref:Uncharacterized protein n=1 Tax=Vigna mungo TaxID=3915 RepID=A0AAQ3RQ66_VIGMU